MKKVVLLSLFLCTVSICMAQNEVKVDSVQTDSTLDFRSSTTEGSVNFQSSIFNLQSFIGFLSYDSALVAMPEYAIVQNRMNETRKAYDAELQRVENEFNSKYEEFLENQKDFPRTILLKRQNELQELMERNIAFKNESRRDLRAQEKQLMAPLRKRLNETIAALAKMKELVLVVNTDSEACPFIDPSVSIDLNKEIQLLLNK